MFIILGNSVSEGFTQEWLVSVSCVGPQLEDSKAGGWNHSKAYSLMTYLIPQLGLKHLYMTSLYPGLLYSTVASVQS